MNVPCSDGKAWSWDIGCCIFMQIRRMGGKQSELDVMFLLTSLLNVFNLHVSDIMERTLDLEDNFPKDLRLICSAVGKLQTPPQMKRKEWIWALITDDRVCCLSALWSQFINIRVETKCNQNPERLIPLQLQSPQRCLKKILIEREKNNNGAIAPFQLPSKQLLVV